MSLAPIIRLLGIGKRFGSRQVLRGIDADVRPGAIVSLVGASGSGLQPARPAASTPVVNMIRVIETLMGDPFVRWGGRLVLLEPLRTAAREGQSS